MAESKNQQPQHVFIRNNEPRVHGLAYKGGRLDLKPGINRVDRADWDKVKDDELTKKVAQETGGKVSQYKVGKVLATADELKPVRTIAAQIRSLTMAFAPSADDIAPGAKFLMTKNYQLYRERVDQHLRIGMRAVDILREGGTDRLHSRKLRSFDEVAFQ